MKTVLYKRFIFCILLQSLFMASLFGQKYENGTRLLKGAEVLSATPLQLDYVLEKLADTAKIDVNIHEGKTHLVLDDGSGKWHEWWYYMGRWRLKQNGGSSGLEKSIQTKQGDGFTGSMLGINEGFIYSLDETPSDVGINNKNATIRVTPQSTAVMEATKTGTNGNILSYVAVAGNEAEQNVSWISQDPRHGSRLRMDTTILEHAQISNVFDFWNFRSSLPDTTFYVKKRIKFDQPNSTIYTKGGDLRLKDQSGDYSLSELADGNDGTVTSVGLSLPTNVFTVTGSPVTNSGTLAVDYRQQPKSTFFAAPITAQGTPVFRQIFLQDLPSISWSFIMSKPTTISGFGITDAYTSTQTRTVIGDTAKVLRNMIKNNVVSESDPVWTAASPNYYTKTNHQTSGQSQVHWNNITNKPTTAGGYGITDVYAKVETRALVGDTANVLRQLIKNSSTSNNNPGGSDGSIQYRNGSTFAGNNYFKWANASNGGHIYFGNATALGGQPKLSAYTSAGSSITELVSHENNGLIRFSNGQLDITDNTVSMRGNYTRVTGGYNLDMGTQSGASTLKMTDYAADLFAPGISISAGYSDNSENHQMVIANMDKEYGMGITYSESPGTNYSDDKFIGLYTSYGDLSQMASNISNRDGAYIWKKYADDRYAEKRKTGTIYWDANEPVLPEESFAFWINNGTFYLILRTGGIQKKVQLQ